MSSGNGPSGGSGQAGSMARDARKQVRAALELPVVMLTGLTPAASNGAAAGIRFESANVSAGGAFLRTDLLLEVGERLMLQFQLPDSGQSIRTGGRVTHVSHGKAKEVPGMGVEFVDLQPGDRAAIEERLRR